MGVGGAAVVVCDCCSCCCSPHMRHQRKRPGTALRCVPLARLPPWLVCACRYRVRWLHDGCVSPEHCYVSAFEVRIPSVPPRPPPRCACRGVACGLVSPTSVLLATASASAVHPTRATVSYCVLASLRAVRACLRACVCTAVAVARVSCCFFREQLLSIEKGSKDDVVSQAALAAELAGSLAALKVRCCGPRILALFLRLVFFFLSFFLSLSFSTHSSHACAPPRVQFVHSPSRGGWRRRRNK